MTVAGEQPIFSAVLTAQRSLGTGGLWLAAGVVAIAGAATALLFLLLGAWPVAGFVGLEIGAALALFLGHHRLARVTEEVVLDRRTLRITRRRGLGAARRWEFSPGWLRVAVEPAAPGRPGGVVLASHGRSVTLGTALSEEDRQGFARALGEALARWRAPEGADAAR
ncbi:MAG: DUF2244 domain-containing protein [Acetobacteraceae bacterium]